MRALFRSYVGYVFFLLGFVSLGLFVAALAFGSALAVWAGIALVVTFAVALAVFRAGSSAGANIWAEPVKCADVDRYATTYRKGEGCTLPADDPAEVTQWRARAA